MQTVQTTTEATSNAAPVAVSAAPVVAKPVVKAVAKPAAKTTAKPAAAKPVTAKPAAKKAAAPAAKKPLAKPAVKTAVKAIAKPAAKPAKPAVAKPAKEKKIKMVRDSISIPKAEYTVLEEMKLRAAKLSLPIKKTELIRAGIKALAALPDAAFLSAVRAVPSLKTGRPAKSA